MANYNFTVTSDFNPMTLEQLLYPVKEYTTEYRAREEAMAQLAEKASIFKNMIKKSDGDLYNTYTDYMSELEKGRDALANGSLRDMTRKQLLDLKTRFNADIHPMEVAYEDRKADIKSQREMDMKSNGKIRRTRYASDIGLGEYMNGNMPNIRQLNLDDVYKETAAGVQALSGRYFSDPEIINLNKMFVNIKEQTGMSDEEALRLLADNNSTFSKFIKSVEDSYGIQDYNSSDQNDIKASISKGIFTGLVNKVENKVTQDPSYVDPATAQQMTLRARADAREAEAYRAEMQTKYNYDKETKTYTLKSDTSNYLPVPDGFEVNGKKASYAKKDDATKMIVIYDEDGNTLTAKTQSDFSKLDNPQNVKDGLTAIDVSNPESENYNPKHKDYNPRLDKNNKNFNQTEFDKKKKGAKGYTSKGEKFTYIDFEKNPWYKWNSFNSVGQDSGNTGSFNPDDADEGLTINELDLNETDKEKIRETLRRYNLTDDDVIVYTDKDTFTDNHYRVTLKGTRKDLSTNNKKAPAGL